MFVALSSDSAAGTVQEVLGLMLTINPTCATGFKYLDCCVCEGLSVADTIDEKESRLLKSGKD